MSDIEPYLILDNPILIPTDLDVPFDYTQLNKVQICDGDKGEIKITRDKNYINMHKKGDEKKYFRYNLNTETFERINFYKTVDDKITEVKVNNITTWFHGCSMYTDDVHFGRLILFAKRHYDFDIYSSSVRFISLLTHPYVKNLELWEALGIKIDEVESLFGGQLGHRRVYNSKTHMYDEKDCRVLAYLGASKADLPMHSISIKYAPSDCCKSLLQYFKSLNKPISVFDINRYVEHYNRGEFDTLQKLIELNNSDDYYHLFCEERYCYLTGSSHRSRNIRDIILDIIHTYDLDLVAFCNFLKRQKNVEQNNLEYLIQRHHYRDYLDMEYHLKNKRKSKMVKYPKNFRTVFHQTEIEYLAIKKQIDDEKFLAISNEHRDLEYRGKKYIMILPDSQDDIVHEANELHHCVRSYIPKVMRGSTLIMFLREKSTPDVPLVTVEVRGNRIPQAYGINDSKPSDEAIEFLKMWAKKKDLHMSCWR